MSDRSPVPATKTNEKVFNPNDVPLKYFQLPSFSLGHDPPYCSTLHKVENPYTFASKVCAGNSKFLVKCCFGFPWFIDTINIRLVNFQQILHFVSTTSNVFLGDLSKISMRALMRPPPFRNQHAFLPHLD